MSSLNPSEVVGDHYASRTQQFVPNPWNRISIPDRPKVALLSSSFELLNYESNALSIVVIGDVWELLASAMNYPRLAKEDPSH